ncbi:hypothetical protein [Aquimarina aquimarini]|uniref:hypothetical protein n=1 Tax=Aquimarina aquimarini TaxID=1191734 RepID=UPI000D54D192|nr:hypothetical protein [Aquimarina aquimarini]
MNLQIRQVVTVLKYTYGLVPIVAGLDKFMNILTNWEQYVAIGMVEMLPFEIGVFMAIIGVVEVVAGILVLYRPQVGGYVVMGWLLAIALLLIGNGHYIDVAVRDVVMAIGAFLLVKLVPFVGQKNH